MLKMAVFGPMPSASAPIAAAANPGAFIRSRTAIRRSDQRTLMPYLPRERTTAHMQVHRQREVRAICATWGL